MKTKVSIFDEQDRYLIASDVVLGGYHQNDPSPSAPVSAEHRERRESDAAAHAERMHALFGDIEDAGPAPKNERQYFVRAHVAPVLKGRLEEKIAKAASPESPCSFERDPRHLIHALKSRVYLVEKAPRLLAFPEGGTGDQWDNLSREYDGWTYKDREFGPDGAVKKESVVTCLRSEFADAHARRVGTVFHLLREGHLAWPEKQPATLSGAFGKALSLATRLGRKIDAEQKAFSASVAVIQRRALG